jgi:hypothetical protein
MQRPTWATVVGIIGIVMAIYTLLFSVTGLMSLISMAIAAFYLFTSILLLQTKPSAVLLFSLAAVVSIGFAILHAVVALLAGPMGIGLMLTGIFVSIVNVVLLSVVATGDKEAFTQQKS